MTGDGSYQTLYKVIVLYILSRVDEPLARSQISDFILERDYTDYLTLQTVFAQLSETGLIAEKKVRNRTLLMLTEEGSSTLSMFSSELTDEIRRDIDTYLRSHAKSLKEACSVSADYHLTSGGSYIAKLTIRENRDTLLSLELSLPDEDLARSVCDNWPLRHEDIYALLMDRLL